MSHDTTDILAQLRAEDVDEPWCGEGGLFQRAADEIERLREVLAGIERVAKWQALKEQP